MFHHIVLLRFDLGAPVGSPRAVAEALRALPPEIPAIRSYDVHVDAGLGAENAQVSVHATFDDEDGWHAYNGHPAHVQVIEQQITPILEAAMRTQYVDDAEGGRR